MDIDEATIRLEEFVRWSNKKSRSLGSYPDEIKESIETLLAEVKNLKMVEKLHSEAQTNHKKGDGRAPCGIKHTDCYSFRMLGFCPTSCTDNV